MLLITGALILHACGGNEPSAARDAGSGPGGSVAHGPCTGDADCGEGACIGESPAGPGNCSSLELIAACDAESGCAEGLHCVLPTGESSGSCQDGTSDGYCNTQEQCDVPLRCVAYDPVSRMSLCSTGEVNAECRADADCNAPLRCIAPPTFFGTCSSGALGEACRSDDFCQSGRCMVLDTTFGIGVCAQAP